MRNARMEWTADELWAELRRRERSTGDAGSERARRRTASVVLRRRDIRDLPTPELAGLLKDRQRVVYGVDDREEVWKIKLPRHRKAADSVVAIVNADQLTENADGSWTLATDSYQEEFNLCGNEPFVNQPTGCHCSGFLVGPDVYRHGRALCRQRSRPADEAVRLRVPDGRRADGANDIHAGRCICWRAASPGGA